MDRYRRTSTAVAVAGLLLARASAGQPEAGSPSTRGGRVTAPQDVTARSDALFYEAKQLRAEGHLVEACDRFAESDRLAPGRGGTLLNLGLCHEEERRFLAARRELRGALAVAQREGRADRVRLATDRLAAVEAKLSWLSLVPPPNVPGDRIELQVDEARVDARDASAVPVEAGHHLVSASASGFVTRTRIVTIDEDAPRTLTVTIASLDAVDARASPPSKANASIQIGGPDGSAGPLPRSTRSEGDHAAFRTAALLTGIGGLVISVATGAWALERKGVVHGHCDGATKVCDATGSDAANVGRALVIVSTVAFAVGAVGLGGWLVVPHPLAGAGAASAGGLSVGGAF
jgi:hypothetical protein